MSTLKFFVEIQRPAMGMVKAVHQPMMVMYSDKSPRPQPMESATGCRNTPAVFMITPS